ncbi:FAD-dependent monooxygenase [Dactylosporangium sp. NPDC005572]|uniref:FAD-dependent monooxygenase n=1 Tax=Dactylosporangium sp. NPDC005572 TaxID=3156889 RepID=UPI0033BC80D6
MLERKALVVGCGVAGPAVAVALRWAGFEVALREARPEPDDAAGGWMMIMPNGLSVLRTLGVEPALRAEGTACDRIVFRDHDNRRLAEVPLPGALSVRRGALHRVLRERAVAAGADVAFGRRLVEVEQSRHGVAGSFEDGTVDAADLLVGCDGPWSRVRAVTMTEARPARYTGIISSAGVCRPGGPALSRHTLEDLLGRRLPVRYATQDSGEVFWSCNTVLPDRPGDDWPAVADNAWRDRLLAEADGGDSPAAALIAATRAIIRQPIYEVPPLDAWHRGRICLVGDAAHAFPPFGGQGASMALEDAVTLARELRDRPGIEAAFTAYERGRRPRVARVAAVARNNRRSLGARSTASRWLRNRMLPVGVRLSAGAARRMYSHEIDWRD